MTQDLKEGKVSLKLAALIQIIVIACGLGGTYAAVRGGVDADRQRLDQQSQVILQLQATLATVQQANATLQGRIDTLTQAISYLNDNLKTIQEYVWQSKTHASSRN